MVLFPSPVGKVRTTIIKIKIKRLGLKIAGLCYKSTFSNINSITFVQLFVIYLCTSMHFYLQKLLLPLLVIVPTITQYLINNILLRFLRMFLKFAE